MFGEVVSLAGLQVTPRFNHFTPAGEETSEFEEDDEDGEDSFDDGPAQRSKPQ